MAHSFVDTCLGFSWLPYWPCRPAHSPSPYLAKLPPCLRKSNVRFTGPSVSPTSVPCQRATRDLFPRSASFQSCRHEQLDNTNGVRCATLLLLVASVPGALVRAEQLGAGYGQEPSEELLCASLGTGWA
eukprot:5609591-Prymnesium_polylepis.1